MERFAPQALETFLPRLALVEKSILTDPATARTFRVAGTPTFVLLDAAGKELTRFFCEFDGRGPHGASRASAGDHRRGRTWALTNSRTRSREGSGARDSPNGLL